MGAWGVGAFENDDAADWAYELEASIDFELVRSVLASVSATAGYLAAADGSIAVAAAAVAAASRPGAVFGVPEPAASWVAAHRTDLRDSDVPLALAAVERVSGEDSELRDLYAGAKPSAFNAWKAAVLDLRGRLA